MRINLIGQIYGCLGIPIHTRGLFEGFVNYSRGHDIVNDIRVYPLVPGGHDYGLQKSITQNIHPHNDFVGSDGLTVVFWSPDIYPLVAQRVNREKTILCGYLIFEWTNLTPEYIKNCMLMDYLLVPSAWAKEILANHGVPKSKIRIVRAGLHYPFDTPRYETPRVNHRRLLMVGKWEARKHHDTIFETLIPLLASQNISLTCLINDPFDNNFSFFGKVSSATMGKLSNQVIRSVPFKQLSSDGDILRIEPHTLGHVSSPVINTPERLIALYCKHDFLIQPSRAGAVELPLLEAQSCGVVPIGMKVSGMADYYTNPALFVASKGKVKMQDDRWFRPPVDWGVWEDMDMKSLEQAIKDAISMSNGSLNNASRYVATEAANKFGYNNIIRDLLMRLRMDENANGNPKGLDILY